VAFRFKSSVCVAVGTFNIYIVQPAWLAGRGIIPKATPIAMEAKLDEPGFRFSSTKMRSKWTVTPTRIDVSSDNPDEDCGAPVSKVLHFLQWTPIKAVGNNATYEAPLSELESLRDLLGVYPACPEGFTPRQRSFHVGLGRGDQVFNVQLSVTDKGVELATNTHTDTTNRDNELAQFAAQNFLQHRQIAEQLACDFFGVEIDHEH
jgi:hypothetical protein